MARPTHDGASLAVWAIVTTLCSVALVVTLQWQRHPANTASGISPIVFFAALMTGLSWGAMVWIDLDPAAMETTVRWFQVAFLLAFTAGVLAGLETSSRMAQLMVISQWLVAAIGFTVAGSALIALGSWVFLPAVAYVYRERQLAMDRLIELQVETRDSAMQAQWTSNHDAVTGKLNRAGLVKQLDMEDSHDGWALFIDLDHFKRVNDRFGHLAGDRVLAEAANRIEHCVGDVGLLARVGGDEFVAVVRGGAEDDALRLAHTIINALEDRSGWDLPSPASGGERQPVGPLVSASIGIAGFTADNLDMDRVVQEADTAMYDVKNGSRGSAALFSTRTHNLPIDRLTDEADFLADLHDGLIEAWAQPIVHLATGHVSHIELLARWRRADGVVTTPDGFLPYVERAGLLPELTDAMLEHAADAIRRLDHHEWLRGAKVAVNISADELAQRDVAAAVQRALALHQIPNGRIAIDLIGATGLGAADTSDVFAQLARLGVGTAIDDFGDSSQSVSALIDVHASIVKLDRALISGAAPNTQRRRAVISALNTLGEGCGYQVVAEAVETVAEARVLYEAGVRHAQGFLFAEPKPLAELMQNATREAIAEYTSDLHQMVDISR